MFCCFRVAEQMCCAHLTRAGVPVCPPVPVSCDEVIYSSARLWSPTRARGGGWRSRPLGYLLFIIYNLLTTELLTFTDIDNDTGTIILHIAEGLLINICS